jgi:hypothetical protein
MSRNQRVTINPREAAALDRLLDAYLATDMGDPGRGDLLALKSRVEKWEHDHSAYEAPAAPTRPPMSGADGC